MSSPAILRGDPRGILLLPKAELAHPEKWTQRDSDVLAHFIQVDSQIRKSRWYQSDCRFTSVGGKLTECEFPAFEEFVFAAVYFRQLVAKRDQLFQEAVKVYCDFMEPGVRTFWTQTELQAFNHSWKSAAFMLPAYTPEELFEAFMYGASLLHTVPREGDSKQARFIAICDHEPRQKVLFAMNGSLRILMKHVGNVATVIYRDYSHWLQDYKLPAPDIRWHENLFRIKSGEEDR